MLRYVIQMELRTLRRDRWAMGLLFLLAALVVMAVTQGARWQKEQQKQTSGIQQMDDERFRSILAQVVDREHQTGTSWREKNDPRITFEIAQQGRVMTLPPLQAAVLAIGHADLLPQLVHVSVGVSESSLWNRLEIENPLHARTGRFDLAFVVVFLLPLFVLALTFHLLPGDREQGIIALSLAQSARLAPLLLTRLAVRGALVMLVLCGATLATMTVMDVPWLRGDTSWRMSMWLVLVAGYTAMWLGLSFLANIYARTAASSALMLATAWLALVILFPALFNAVLVRVCAPPSRVQLVSAMRTATREATGEASKTLAKYYQDHPELRPPGAPNEETEFIAQHFATRERTERDVAPVLKQFAEQVDKQQQLVSRWQYLLPPVLVDQAFSDLAGTGSIRHGHFRAQVRKALADWQGWFVPRIVKSQVVKAADKDAVPQPAYVDETRSDLLPRVLPAILLLVILAGVFIGWGVAVLRRYTVQQPS